MPKNSETKNSALAVSTIAGPAGRLIAQERLNPSQAQSAPIPAASSRMPGSVRARFAAQLEQDPENANAKRMLENFDRALSHPDEADLAAAAFFSNGKLAGDTAAAESL